MGGVTIALYTFIVTEPLIYYELATNFRLGYCRIVIHIENIKTNKHSFHIIKKNSSKEKICLFYLYLIFPNVLKSKEFSTEFNNKIQRGSTISLSFSKGILFRPLRSPAIFSKMLFRREAFACLFSFYIISYDVLFIVLLGLCWRLNSQWFEQSLLLLAKLLRIVHFAWFYISNAFSLFLSGFCCSHKTDVERTWHFIYFLFQRK